MFSWVKLDLFSLKCNEVSSSEFFGIYGFGMALGSLLMLRAVFLLCRGILYHSATWEAPDYPILLQKSLQEEKLKDNSVWF